MLALLAASILTIASAGGLDRLAPPKACAEPREAVAAVPGREATEAEVLGALQSFFHPSDEAAPPKVAARRTPRGVATVRYAGVCETLDAARRPRGARFASMSARCPAGDALR